MKLHELLSDPSRWTKGATARNSIGNIVSSYDPTAVCFCLIGAIFRIYPDDYPNAFNERVAIHKQLEGRLSNHDIVGWNDAPERTHEEVLALLKELDI